MYFRQTKHAADDHRERCSNPLREMPTRLRTLAGLLLVLSVALCAQTRVPAKTAVPTDSNSAIKITILGSGGGPRPNAMRYGAAIFVEASGEKLLFDCGRGAVIRMAQAGIREGEVDKLFLTHLHSDHIVSIPDLLLTGWGEQGRKVPLRVWGPAGTKSMMDYMLKAFDFDIHIRRDVDEKFDGEGVTVQATDIQEGVVYEHNGVKVSAFLVDHGPVKPAFGYRVDAGGHSVAMSGDTRFSENLIKHATGVDVLIHEVGGGGQALLASGLTPEQAQQIQNHHTPPIQTGIVFNRVKPKLAVYAHGGSPAAVAEARKNYSGPLEVAEDLMVIDVGDKVEVRRPQH